MSDFWFNYVWPSIKGNGPEDLLFTLVGAAFVGIAWPRIKALWAEDAADIKAHVTAEHKVIHARLDDLHVRIDEVATTPPPVLPAKGRGPLL